LDTVVTGFYDILHDCAETLEADHTFYFYTSCVVMTYARQAIWAS